MAFSLIIIGLIIGGLLTLVSLIFIIISLAGGKNQGALAWGGAFVVALIIVVFSVIQLAHRIKDKAKAGIEWLEEHGNSANQNYSSGHETDYLKTERQEFLDTLQLHINSTVESKVPADFYINKEVKADAKGIMTLPFVYPYSIRYNTTTYTGDIIIADRSDSVFVHNVSQVAFDENFAIIKIDNSQSPEALKKNHSETEYLLYDLRTRNFEPAANKEKLMDLARRIGYNGPAEMNYLSEDYRGWVDAGETESYD